MERAELPNWTKFILIAYVVVYLVFYALFTVNHYDFTNFEELLSSITILIALFSDNDFLLISFTELGNYQ
jgi:CRISPR/Cas system-associated endonuclease/helicase Cas3